MIRRMAVPASLVAGMLFTALVGPVEAQTPGGSKWVVDPVHSQIDFRVRHLVGRVRGTFTDWYAIIIAKDGDWRHGVVNMSAQTGTLNTGNAIRDADLRSDHFFAVEQYPQMTFEGSGIVATDSTATIAGTLTIKGHVHPVALTGQYRGVARDSEGHERVAFEVTTTLDRRDYGMTWSPTVAGSDLVGNEVEISVALEAVRVN